MSLAFLAQEQPSCPLLDLCPWPLPPYPKSCTMSHEFIQNADSKPLSIKWAPDTPKAAQLVQEAELNVNTFISLPRNSWGQQPRKQLCGLIRDVLSCQSPQAPSPETGQQCGASTSVRCPVSRLSHLRTGTPYLPPGYIHMVPQQLGWFSPAVSKAILAPAQPFSKPGDSFLQWVRPCACHTLALRLWTSCLASWYLNFFIC